MKKLFVCLIVCVPILAFSQVKVGFELGGSLLQNVDSISYTNKTICYSGDIGISVEVPLLNNRIALETGLLFYDIYYKAEGPHVRIMVNEEFGSGFYVSPQINDIGLKIPLRFITTFSNFSPFVGAEICKSLNSHNGIDVGLYGAGGGTGDNKVHGRGEYALELSSFTWNLCAGLYYNYSPTTKLRLQYSLGMNNFVSYTFTERIINDVVIDPPYTDKARMQQLQLAVVYSPDWKIIKEKRAGKLPLKERMKAVYQ